MWFITHLYLYQSLCFPIFISESLHLLLVLLFLPFRLSFYLLFPDTLSFISSFLFLCAPFHASISNFSLPFPPSALLNSSTLLYFLFTLSRFHCRFIPLVFSSLISLSLSLSISLSLSPPLLSHFSSFHITSSPLSSSVVYLPVRLFLSL